MPRLAFILALIIATALALSAACGGGEEPVEVMAIERVDLTGMELTIADEVNPPFAEEYPDVVAMVNGEPVTSKDLASTQVHYAAIGDERDPLEQAIYNKLAVQAADRLGLLMSHDEAVEDARRAQEAMTERIIDGTQEERETAEYFLFMNGLSLDDDWSTDEAFVEGLRTGPAYGLLSPECRKEYTMQEIVALQEQDTRELRDTCRRFLDKERENADVVYYVRWVD